MVEGDDDEVKWLQLSVYRSGVVDLGFANPRGSHEGFPVHMDGLRDTVSSYIAFI